MCPRPRGRTILHIMEGYDLTMRRVRKAFVTGYERKIQYPCGLDGNIHKFVSKSGAGWVGVVDSSE